MTRAIQLPADREIVDESGRVKTAWLNFLNNLQKYPAAPLADLPSNASTADIVARVNALAAILRSNKLLSQ